MFISLHLPASPNSNVPQEGMYHIHISHLKYQKYSDSSKEELINLNTWNFCSLRPTNYPLKLRLKSISSRCSDGTLSLIFFKCIPLLSKLGIVMDLSKKVEPPLCISIHSSKRFCFLNESRIMQTGFVTSILMGLSPIYYQQ